eukprot:TRINITY_DN2335_c0_g1_i2.p1 TRINITY_DN2335_c0_g1~~TRINITY_DN2335_c0_g1_i2.p1  ORF type:complete len:423 (-),score=76.88 TRINITY_DN2335_c0_g1_i2:311-1579(-)
MELSSSSESPPSLPVRKGEGGEKVGGKGKAHERKPKKANKTLFTSVPRYIIDLDLPPEQRWNQVVDDYKDEFKEIEKWVAEESKDFLGNKLGPFVKGLASTIMGWVNGLGAIFYSKELKGMAKRSGMELGLLVTMQLVYEASTCCTSVVVVDDKGIPHHVRTMDWELEFLEPLTIEVDFQRGGVSQYCGTTWAGYVGLLTGMSPGICSASVNFRVTNEGSLWTNVKKALSQSWPVGFLLRETLSSAKSFDQAVSYLSNSPLIAPVYYTVAGARAHEGALITRNVKKAEHTWSLKDDGLIVQTNVDHFMDEDDDDAFDILDSYTRRKLARRLMENLTNWDIATFWNIMSSPPIFNSLTIYGTYMSPASKYFETRLPAYLVGFTSVPETSINARNFREHAAYVSEKDSADQDPTVPFVFLFGSS